MACSSACSPDTSLRPGNAAQRPCALADLCVPLPLPDSVLPSTDSRICNWSQVGSQQMQACLACNVRMVWYNLCSRRSSQPRGGTQATRSQAMFTLALAQLPAPAGSAKSQQRLTPRTVKAKRVLSSMCAWPRAFRTVSTLHEAACEGHAHSYRRHVCAFARLPRPWTADLHARNLQRHTAKAKPARRCDLQSLRALQGARAARPSS